MRTYAVRGLHARLSELHAERARILELLSVWDSSAPSRTAVTHPEVGAAAAPVPDPAVTPRRRRRASRVATNPDVVAEAAPDAAPVTVEREEARILPRRRARVQVPAEPPAPALPPMPRLVKAKAS